MSGFRERWDIPDEPGEVAYRLVGEVGSGA